MFSLLDVVGLPALPPIEVLDIGARIEDEPRWASLLAHRAAHVTAFEPQAEDRARLEAMDSAITCLPHVLGDGGPATFHVTSWPGCCSLYEPDPAVVDVFHSLGTTHPQGGLQVVSKHEVQTTRLDAVPGLRPPDSIKIDVQGAELLVLEHGQATLRSAVVVEAEVEFVPLYRDQPLFGELQVFMRQRGFVFHRFVDITGRACRPFPIANPVTPVSQFVWADAIFIRDPFQLSAWSDTDLLRGAILLHDLYGSFDLVMRLLAEYDARRGTRGAIAYADRLRQMGPMHSRFASFRQPAESASRQQPAVRRVHASTPTTASVSAYLQGHADTVALFECLRSFRLSYPNASLTLVSDDGDDLAEVARHFGGLFVHSRHHADPRGFADGFQSVEVYLGRLYEHCRRVSSEWVVLLEEDVRTLRAIRDFPVTECAGPRMNSYSSQLTEYLVRNHGDKRYGYGMCGGSIFRRSAFMQAFEKSLSRIESLAHLDPRILKFSDIPLTLVFQITGMTYSEWTDVSEVTHPTHPIVRDSAFDHAYKYWYQFGKRS